MEFLKKKYKMKVLLCFKTYPKPLKWPLYIMNFARTSLMLKLYYCSTPRNAGSLAFFCNYPDYDLVNARCNRKLKRKCRILKSIDTVLLKEMPDLVLVRGIQQPSLMVS
jgi:UDP-N-acetylglucosamine 2-epimerase